MDPNFLGHPSKSKCTPPKTNGWVLWKRTLEKEKHREKHSVYLGSMSVDSGEIVWFLRSFHSKRRILDDKKMGLILNLWMALALLEYQPQLSQNIHYSTLMEWSSQNISKLRTDWVFEAFHRSGGKFFLLHPKGFWRRAKSSWSATTRTSRGCQGRRLRRCLQICHWATGLT